MTFTKATRELFRYFGHIVNCFCFEGNSLDVSSEEDEPRTWIDPHKARSDVFSKSYSCPLLGPNLWICHLPIFQKVRWPKCDKIYPTNLLVHVRWWNRLKLGLIYVNSERLLFAMYLINFICRLFSVMSFVLFLTKKNFVPHRQRFFFENQNCSIQLLLLGSTFWSNIFIE